MTDNLDRLTDADVALHMRRDAIDTRACLSRHGMNFDNHYDEVAPKAHAAEASVRLCKGKNYVCLVALIFLDGPTTPTH